MSSMRVAAIFPLKKLATTKRRSQVLGIVNRKGEISPGSPEVAFESVILQAGLTLAISADAVP